MQQWQVGPVPEYIYSNSTHQPSDMHPQHPYQQDMSRRDQHPQFQYGAPPHQSPAPQHHQPTPVQPPMTVPQPPQPPQAQPHPQQQQQHHQQQQQHHQQQQQQHAVQPPPQPAPQPQRNRKRPAPAPAQQAPPVVTSAPPMPPAPVAPTATPIPPPQINPPVAAPPPQAQPASTEDANAQAPQPPPAKKSRTNTPWTPAEELRLKQMRDAGSSWAEIAKTFPTRTEGSVKKHWYKDMHYAEFAEDESQALLNAIKEYENNKWKVIGQKVGKPAKACEQYAKEHFPDLYAKPTNR
ncbi:MYB DNA-binding domain-containing protein [Colletotrichum orchidophilum]|uniref:MYB DNA-binding domain-containing protein n=1 Tax=Colletotrichum orchidophilum TaxID=1209926 RepID=A0A1G4B565_9PEZI|nr:MYB DNA-binding domain-containing protein [Colletotrichum orchidophilum]OHE96544.1 MYB DNA-binding domain-containing protein [Colletotrichum orchidophilum]